MDDSSNMHESNNIINLIICPSTTLIVRWVHNEQSYKRKYIKDYVAIKKNEVDLLDLDASTQVKVFLSKYVLFDTL